MSDRLAEIRGRLKNGAPPPAETIEGPHQPSTLNSERQWVASQIEQFGLRFVLVGAMLTSAKALPEHGSLAGWMWAVAERMGGLLLAREQDGADLAWLIGEVERLTAERDAAEAALATADARGFARGVEAASAIVDRPEDFGGDPKAEAEERRRRDEMREWLAEHIRALLPRGTP